MLHDYGSRDDRFIELNRRICNGLLSLCDAGHTHLCIPLQGSGSFAVEAMIANQVPGDGKLLNLVNGAYGHRVSEICSYIGRRVSVLETEEHRPVDIAGLDRVLASDEEITHVAVVYCETTSGIANPVADIAEVVATHRRSLLIDAMSAFGALSLSAAEIPFAALAASANKCLESVPGMGFVIAARESFPATEGNAHSASLDLYRQWRSLDESGQWRFTPSCPLPAGAGPGPCWSLKKKAAWPDAAGVMKKTAGYLSKACASLALPPFCRMNYRRRSS